MREIRFRAWDKEEKQVFEVESIDFINGFVGIVSGVPSLDLEIEKVILMQFTGLLDKNGKEIFEGDIVHLYQKDFFEDGVPGETRDLDDNGKVTFHDAAFWVDLIGENKHWEAMMLNQKDVEVEAIGNIHENPTFL